MYKRCDEVGRAAVSELFATILSLLSWLSLKQLAVTGTACLTRKGKERLRSDATRSMVEAGLMCSFDALGKD